MATPSYHNSDKRCVQAYMTKAQHIIMSKFNKILFIDFYPENWIIVSTLTTNRANILRSIVPVAALYSNSIHDSDIKYLFQQYECIVTYIRTLIVITNRPERMELIWRTVFGRVPVFLRSFQDAYTEMMKQIPQCAPINDYSVYLSLLVRCIESKTEPDFKKCTRNIAAGVLRDLHQQPLSFRCLVDLLKTWHETYHLCPKSLRDLFYRDLCRFPLIEALLAGGGHFETANQILLYSRRIVSVFKNRRGLNRFIIKNRRSKR